MMLIFHFFFPFRVARKWSNLPTATNHARENFLEHFKSLELSICTPIHNRINQNSQYTYFRSQKLEIKTRVKLTPPGIFYFQNPPVLVGLKSYWDQTVIKLIVSKLKSSCSTMISLICVNSYILNIWSNFVALIAFILMVHFNGGCKQQMV